MKFPLSKEARQINKEIFKLSLPTMSGSLFQAFYDIVDMVWIGMINTQAVAAATIFITLFWVVEILNEVVGTSSISMLSQYYGSGDMKKTRDASEQTFVFKALLGVIGAVVMMILLPPFFHLYSKDPKVIAYGMRYGYIRILFLPVFFSSFTVNTIFRCTGDAKTPMRLLIVSAVLNLILDPLLMFDKIPGTSIHGLGWGMVGAAVATVISVTLSFSVGFFILVSGRGPITIRSKGIFHLDWALDRKLLTIGLPSGLNLLLRNVVTFVILKLVSSFGTGAIAVLGIANRIYQFGAMPSSGLGMGSGIIVGQALGSDEVLKARHTVFLTSVNGLAFSVLVSIAFFVFPRQLLSLFLGEEDINLFDGVGLMYVYGLSLMVLSLMSGLGAAFFGSGKTHPILYASLISQWCFQVPYALFVTLVLHLPVTYLWVAYFIGDFIECVGMYIYYRKGEWTLHRV
jgi:putative MATE family efflux protein